MFTYMYAFLSIVIRARLLDLISSLLSLID